jgi:hypothetical protein
MNRRDSVGRPCRRFNPRCEQALPTFETLAPTKHLNRSDSDSDFRSANNRGCEEIRHISNPAGFALGPGTMFALQTGLVFEGSRVDR